MTTELPDEKILDRIKKLHAKAVSAKEIGSEAEAVTFMNAVQKMLDKYQMSMSDVEYELDVKQNPIDCTWVNPEDFGDSRYKKTRDKEQMKLARNVAFAFDCVFIGSGGRSFSIVGRKEKREVCAYLITTLLRTMEELAEKEYVKFFYQCRDEGDVTKARGFKAAFRTGFVVAIDKRCAEIINQKYTQKTGGTKLAVRQDADFKAALSWVDERIKSGALVKASHIQGRQSDNAHGFMKGAAEGSKANLTGNAVSKSSSSKTKLLGQGS